MIADLEARSNFSNIILSSKWITTLLLPAALPVAPATLVSASFLSAIMIAHDPDDYHTATSLVRLFAFLNLGEILRHLLAEPADAMQDTNNRQRCGFLLTVSLSIGRDPHTVQISSGFWIDSSIFPHLFLHILLDFLMRKGY